MATSGGAEPDPAAAIVCVREREVGARPRRCSVQGTKQGKEEECPVGERERGGPARRGGEEGCAPAARRRWGGGGAPACAIEGGGAVRGGKKRRAFLHIFIPFEGLWI